MQTHRASKPRWRSMSFSLFIAKLISACRITLVWIQENSMLLWVFTIVLKQMTSCPAICGVTSTTWMVLDDVVLVKSTRYNWHLVTPASWCCKNFFDGIFRGGGGWFRGTWSGLAIGWGQTFTFTRFHFQCLSEMLYKINTMNTYNCYYYCYT